MADSNSLFKIECPFCHETLEVQREWDGRKAECPYCAEKFIIQLTPTADPERFAPDITEQQESFLKSAGLHVVASGGKLYVDVSGMDAHEAMQFCMKVTTLGLEFLDKWDKYSGKYQELADAGVVWAFVLGKWKIIAGDFERAAERAKAQNVSNERLKVELYDLRNRIASTISAFSWPQVFGFVECPYITCNVGESVLWFGKACHLVNDDAVECYPVDYEGANALDGYLFVTSERVVFTSESHRQEYKISGIRTVKTNWHDYRGSLIVGSSSRKREKYIADEMWKPALILLILWNEFMRARFIQSNRADLVADVCQSLCVPLSFAGKKGVSASFSLTDIIELNWQRVDRQC